MNIAIAGYGVEGKSSYEYFLSKGNTVTILDERDTITDLPEGAKTVLGEDAFLRLGNFDMVIRTPSLPPHRLESAKKIWSATNEFFKECSAPIIGVTGTKGKGTTASLIASILEKAGKRVHLVGNIGKPALSELSRIQTDDIVVYELSSFQLWDIEKSPTVAVVLMIEADHLDVHSSFEEYLAAKGNIIRHQAENDTVVFAKNNLYAGITAANSRAQKIAVQSEFTFYVKDGFFWHEDDKICSINALKIPGAHNRDNACAAIAAVWNFTQDNKAIEEGLGAFSGLPHRLKYVRTVKGVAYYDDSIATTIGSAVAAISAFPQPKVIILGGSSKGAIDFGELARNAAGGNVRSALLIGEQADAIEKSFIELGLKTETFDATFKMKDIVRRASEIAEPGDVVILSPACASFGLFKNYADRGDQFVAAVNAL